MRVLASCTMVGLAAALAALLAGAAPAAAQKPGCSAGTEVTTSAGALCGRVTGVPLAGGAQIRTYRGIPFALPPVPGQGGRWTALEDPAPFADPPFAATRFGKICAQAVYGAPSIGAKSLTTVDGATLAGSEDCLTLNVYAPAGAGPGSALPVMVFFYGGAFVSGAASQPTYDAGYLAAAGDVVVVTANYRLGAYGFLYAEAAGDAPAIAGNFGLLDQQKALGWVRDNVAAFGGDPGRVTLFGESAGAMSVGLHLFAVPSSNGLFQQAIMESNPLNIAYRAPAEAAAAGKAFLADLCDAYRQRKRAARCPARAELIEKATSEDIFAAQMAFSDANANMLARMAAGGIGEALVFAPTLDGTLVVGQPNAGFAEGVEKRPFLFGVNRDEGVVFAALSNGESPISEAAYGAALEGVFGPAGRDRILAYAPGGERIYSPQDAPRVPYYTPAASAFARFVDDYWFRCANLNTARLAARQLAAEGLGAAIHAYDFVQPPAFNSFGPAFPACAVAAGNVCHGNELPYVFNTLASVTPAAPPADRALATTMAGAWTAYARTGSPGAGWPAFDGTLRSPAQVLADPVPAAPSLDTLGNCSAFWYAQDDPVEPRR